MSARPESSRSWRPPEFGLEQLADLLPYLTQAERAELAWLTDQEVATEETAPPADAEDLAARASSLAAYAAGNVPSFQLVSHVGRLIAKLEAVERGEIRRLMVAMPPRHGKSLLTSVQFPAWYLGRHPEREIICASYSQAIASGFGRRVRNLVLGPTHERIFPGAAIARDSTAADRFNLQAGGAYYAVGRGASTTGRGADVFVIDDPLRDRAEADSEAIRAALKAWYSEVVYTRLSPVGAIVVVATRWHKDDLTGWLLEHHADEGWDVLSLPAIAETDEPGHRAEGEALWPQRFGLKLLEKIRRQLGPEAFAALYQQQPAAAEGVIFKRSRWGRYAVVPARFDRIIQSWDTAFKTGRENDYSVCTTWGKSGWQYYLLHVYRDRIGFPALVAKAQELAERWKPDAVLIEDKASGQSLVQQLRSATKLPVVPVPVDKDKRARANAVSHLWESESVLVPAVEQPWLPAYLEEMAAFPFAAHDDQVDSTTMALHNLSYNAASAWLELARQAEAESAVNSRAMKPGAAH